jgi:ABC-type lipoprotein export system ATPase subunit
LDTKSGKEILKILHDLHEEGKTVIIVTHDESIALITDRVIKISDGKIIEDRIQVAGEIQ